jgi:hypothetical protein
MLGGGTVMKTVDRTKDPANTTLRVSRASGVDRSDDRTYHASDNGEKGGRRTNAPAPAQED